MRQRALDGDGFGDYGDALVEFGIARESTGGRRTGSLATMAVCPYSARGRRYCERALIELGADGPLDALLELLDRFRKGCKGLPGVERPSLAHDATALTRESEKGSWKGRRPRPGGCGCKINRRWAGSLHNCVGSPP